MRAREIMTDNPECVTEKDSVQQAARRMKELDVGLIPVVDDDSGRHLRGVITDRDITIRHVAEGHTSDCPVTEGMSRDRLVTASPDDDVDTLMARMRENQVRRVPIVENDRLVGIVAQADLATRTPQDEAEEVEHTIEEISEPARPRR
ncbi:MAG TPA: CBS domain-containing protein [Longimicrobiales bacterium]|nr:CBS domain-containing protein [Longimicrobiales bacterium]